MARAIELGRHGMNRGDGGPFGAVVARDGHVIGEGWNQVLARNDPTAHGEMTAIREACARTGGFSLEGCEIYTTGQPCPMCLGAIYWARLRAVHYGFGVAEAARIGFDDSEFYEQIRRPADLRRVPESVLCPEEALELVREYAALPRTPY